MAEEGLPEVVAFLQALVAIPSVNGVHDERSLATRIVEEAERLGLGAQRVGLSDTRPNALVEWGRGARGFAFIGHMDTVSEGSPTAWTYPPFGAEIHDGKLYGRGAADNKAGIACALYAIHLVQHHRLFNPASARLILAAVVDEESGASSPLGVRYLLDDNLLVADGAIYTYASDIICIGHRGLLRLIVRAQGEAIHSGSQVWSRGEGGVNAVTGLAALLVQLEKLDLPAQPHPSFGNLRPTITPGTVMRGGDFESMVPEWAEATVDIRLMPGQAAQEVVEAVERIIDVVTEERPGLTITLEIKNSLPAATIPAGHRLVELARKYTRVITGHEWRVAGAGPTNEGYMLIEAGIPTLCGFGPRGGNAHAPDEWVDIDSLASTIAMYVGIAIEYLTNETENTA